MKHRKKNQEIKIYGRYACLNLFKHRPEDLIRLYITQEGVFEYKPLLRHCADHKLAYHIVDVNELEAITKSTHHEGIALIAKRKVQPEFSEIFKTPGMIVALEGVENPHNLGAIIRSSAHFGVKAIVYEAKVPVALSAAALRTAEGGAEGLFSYHVEHWNEFFDLAEKNQYKVYATSSHEGTVLYQNQFDEKSILFFGSEGEGLSDKMMKKINHYIQIPGTGMVESLNVSNATAVILGEWYRQVSESNS